MPLQRQRLRGKQVPQRNPIVRPRFVEGQSPSELTPITPVTTPGGSIRVDADTGKQSYIHIVGDEGLTFKKPDDDVRLARVDGLHNLGTPFDDTEIIFGAEELFDDPAATVVKYGPEVVRDAFFSAFIHKNSSNPSLATDNNLAEAYLQTQINSGTPAANVAVVSKNDGSFVQLLADRVVLAANNSDAVVGVNQITRMVAQSELSGGTIGPVTTTETDIISFSWTAYVNRQYRIKLVALRGISSTVADDLARVWYTDNSNNHIVGMNATPPTANRSFPFDFETYESGLSGTVNRKFRFVRVGGTGSLNFDAPTDGPTYVCVETVG